jgi:hypothetical protein
MNLVTAEEQNIEHQMDVLHAALDMAYHGQLVWTFAEINLYATRARANDLIEMQSEGLIKQTGQKLCSVTKQYKVAMCLTEIGRMAAMHHEDQRTGIFPLLAAVGMTLLLGACLFWVASV